MARPETCPPPEPAACAGPSPSSERLRLARIKGAVNTGQQRSKAGCGRARGCMAEPGHAGSHDFHKRPGVEAEASDRRVAETLHALNRAAGGAGLALAKHPRKWLRRVEAALAEDVAAGARRADGAETVMNVARGLAAMVRDWRKAVTLKGTWAALCEAAGRCRRTVAYALGWLQDRALLACVATGAAAATSPTGENLAPVYALVDVPDIDCTPTPLGVEYEPTCAREALRIRTGALRAAASLAAGAAGRGAAPEQPALGPRASARKERMGAAAALMEAVPELARRAKRVVNPSTAGGYSYQPHPTRRTSVKAIAAVIRPYLAAGWTERDIRAWCIDRKPDGSPWPHSGASGALSGPEWLRRRLAAWLDPATGQPLPSSSQRDALRRRADAVERREREARDAADAAELAAERVRHAAEHPGMTAREIAALKNGRTLPPRGRSAAYQAALAATVPSGRHPD